MTQLGIKLGVRKISVDTDNRLAVTGAIGDSSKSRRSSIRAVIRRPRAKP
jgi:fructose/tagatose bisphosphate aldolase